MSFTHYPQQLGKYRIDALLGQGAMGVVYKAFDSEIDREVAIKILHLHLLAGDMGDELARRFANEVKAAARCQHPNIVTVYDYGVSQGQPYMVMEYVKGVDLQVFLKSGQSLSTEQAINLILKVLDALYSAHEMGIVHRDIKPANIMLLENGQIKVTDFGVAHIEDSDLTQAGDVIGTPSYMSPEAHSGSVVTASSDLYAAALVLLELLINKRVKAKEINSVMLTEQLTARNLAPQLVKNLADVLDKALQPYPQQRYADARTFSKALNSCLDLSADYYQIASDLAATVLMVKSTIQPSIAVQGNSDTLFVAATSSVVLQGQLTVIERNLTHYLGPVAKMLVKKQAKQSDNISQLVNSLISQIPSSVDRQNFINSLDFSITNSDELAGNRSVLSTYHEAPASLFDTDYIEQLTTDLTRYLGPVAKHLMKSTLKKVSSKEALCACLADKIPNLKERAEFLKNRDS
jgi:serine/threonine-protein kinase